MEVSGVGNANALFAPPSRERSSARAGAVLCGLSRPRQTEVGSDALRPGERRGGCSDADGERGRHHWQCRQNSTDSEMGSEEGYRLCNGVRGGGIIESTET